MVAFGVMRPTSPYIQLLHSIATYAVRGGASECHNKDFAYVGDRTSFRTPAPVLLDDKVWKWVTKKINPDILPMEHFYADDKNATVLFEPPVGSAEVNTSVPRMAYLPPPFLAFCLEKQRTPFELHRFITTYATRDGSETTVDKCTTLTNWCMVAAHRSASPTTSVLATTLEMAPGDDDDFLRWLQTVDVTKSHGTAAAAAATPAAGTTGIAATGPAGAAATCTIQPPPPPDVWTQMAQSISKSFATAAAAMRPDSDPRSSFENGGSKYDEFQMAIIQGFAHVEDITGVPIIWALFQYTKSLDTHKDNVKRRMTKWASTTTRDRPEHVQIDRSLYITDAAMRDILALNFNPGGVAAEADTADKGLSILCCRARTSAQRAEIRRLEKAADKSKRNWSKKEAEDDEVTAYDTGALPDDYNELLRCLGTYCALLHTLFGEKCVFYRNCYKLWETMNSEFVFEKREKFGKLTCRRIVWALIEESRIFFAKRLSVDDFADAKFPEDIPYPTCSLATIIQCVRDGIEIERSTFPPTWYPGNATRTVVTGSGSAAPVPSIMAPTASPSVISGITTVAASTCTDKPPVTIRATNIHPLIKSEMEAYIAKVRGVHLTPLLNHANLTIDDLPKLPPEVSGTNGICYNWVLGRCTFDRCRHLDGHVNARDVTDEFVNELLRLLRPSITDFKTNGLPPNARRRNRRRRRAE